MRCKHATAVVVAVSAAMGIGIPAAYAYWTANGVGAGVGATDAGQPIGFSAGPVTPARLLFPGGTADVVVTVVNPYANKSIVITNLLGIVTTNQESVCPGAHNFTVASAPNPLPQAMAPGATVKGVIRDAISMNPDASNACQGVGVTVVYSVKGTLG